MEAVQKIVEEPSGDPLPVLARFLSGTSDRRAALSHARDTATALVAAGCSEFEAEQFSVLSFTASALRRLAESGKEASARRLIAEAASVIEVTPTALALAVAKLALHDPELFGLPPREAIRTQLRLLAALPPVQAASLWDQRTPGRLRCVAHRGGRPTPGARQAARAAIADGRATSASPRRSIVAVPAGPGGAPVGAVVGRTAPGAAAAALLLLMEAAPPLAAALEREAALRAAEGHTATATKAAERQLARFGLDLHDGPAQGAARLVADMRLFRDQLEGALPEGSRAIILTGRVEDLEARALALSAEIRDLARLAQAPASLREPVAEALRWAVRAFARATGIEPALEVKGPIDALTPSQRIALLRAVEQSLRNVRQHARAARVSVRVTAFAERIEAEIRDDGRGFDVPRALARASRDGRMGLLGMIERAQLLGGRCELQSARGGPTTIRVQIPRWESG